MKLLLRSQVVRTQGYPSFITSHVQELIGALSFSQVMALEFNSGSKSENPETTRLSTSCTDR